MQFIAVVPPHFAKGWQAVGAEKSQWAEKITPHMDVTNNASPSFDVFPDKSCLNSLEHRPDGIILAIQHRS